MQTTSLNKAKSNWGSIGSQSSSPRITRGWWMRLHIDPILLLALLALAVTGIFILYSASDKNSSMVASQILHVLVAFGLMIAVAQISPDRLYKWAPWLFGLGVILLAAVLVVGHVDQGAKRWIGFGAFRFQPSELMKLAMPMMLAWYLHEKKLPPTLKTLMMSVLFLLVPAALTAKEPDLGTAIIIACSGFVIIVLAGINWRYILSGFVALCAFAPVLWHFMHQYQRDRVLTFLNPERDPLGTGYHIIQSKIAIGSGGFFGKGWLHGTQSHLSFLPAHTTDFIFAVAAEELGLVGCIFIILLFIAIGARCLYIGSQAQNTFTRLLAGSLGITFIISSFVNIGMVIGILPVVGIPLPLISYGGSYMISMMIGFGIIMSIQTHRKLWSS